MVGGENTRLMVILHLRFKIEGKIICMRYDGASTNLKYFANGRFIKESNETEPSFVSNLF